ncbi:hypothetical protein SSS_02493 [Sarcoptes scabiei]|uniref:Uncharacterized protein n=1 Tax=Sarcoptes scabiei TaxID=52283 RepID=A0A834VCZ3_SARSC|nr:hypothetical protein SSS_02493 [Sarcoptes scabiei]
MFRSQSPLHCCRTLKRSDSSPAFSKKIDDNFTSCNRLMESSSASSITNDDQQKQQYRNKSNRFLKQSKNRRGKSPSTSTSSQSSPPSTTILSSSSQIDPDSNRTVQNLSNNSININKFGCFGRLCSETTIDANNLNSNLHQAKVNKPIACNNENRFNANISQEISTTPTKSFTAFSKLSNGKNRKLSPILFALPLSISSLTSSAASAAKIPSPQSSSSSSIANEIDTLKLSLSDQISDENNRPVNVIDVTTSSSSPPPSSSLSVVSCRALVQHKPNGPPIPYTRRSFRLREKFHQKSIDDDGVGDGELKRNSNNSGDNNSIKMQSSNRLLVNKSSSNQSIINNANNESGNEIDRRTCTNPRWSNRNGKIRFSFLTTLQISVKFLQKKKNLRDRFDL